MHWYLAIVNGVDFHWKSCGGKKVLCHYRFDRSIITVSIETYHWIFSLAVRLSKAINRYHVLNCICDVDDVAVSKHSSELLILWLSTRLRSFVKCHSFCESERKIEREKEKKIRINFNESECRRTLAAGPFRKRSQTVNYRILVEPFAFRKRSIYWEDPSILPDASDKASVNQTGKLNRIHYPFQANQPASLRYLKRSHNRVITKSTNKKIQWKCPQ